MANKNQERSAYEKKWQQAFEEAEITPSADLWKNIDTQLTRQETGKYKRGFFFYRAVAAACLLCLIGLGIYAVNDYFLHQDSRIKSMAQEPLKEKNAAPEAEEAQNPALAKQNTQPSPIAQDRHLSQEKTTPEKPVEGQEQQRLLAAADKKQQSPALSQGAERVAEAPAFVRPNEGDQVHMSTGISLLSAYGMAAAPPVDMEWLEDIKQLYRVPNPYHTEKSKKKKKEKPAFFAGLNFSGGYFDPNMHAQAAAGSLAPAAFSASPYDYMENNQLRNLGGANTQQAGVNNTPQASLSYGANVGMHVTEHLTLESGIDYGRFNSNTKTNLAIENLSSEKRYPLLISNSANASFNDISFTSETKLTNSFELVSVPMKLGYYFLFDKFNLFVSSGMAANFFINNSIIDASGKFATVNIPADTDSPYKKVFYSGIISGGIHYNFLGSYFFTFSPEYSFSVTPMTKEGTFIHSQPFSFGVDIGLRYNFK